MGHLLLTYYSTDGLAGIKADLARSVPRIRVIKKKLHTVIRSHLYKVKKFLAEVALGMVLRCGRGPMRTGGYIVVRSDGEVVMLSSLQPQ